MVDYAKKYSEQATTSPLRNNHMNELSGDEEIDPKVAEAIIVDFINFIGVKNCIDYGLYIKDLDKK